MKILFSLFLIICFNSSLAQRVFYSSQDLNRSDNQRPIEAIHPHWGAGRFASKITVIYTDGNKQKIDRDSIWGFELKDRTQYRCYQGDIYRIEKLDDLLMYVNTISRFSSNLYGKTLDSPLYGSKRQARKEIATN